MVLIAFSTLLCLSRVSLVLQLVWLPVVLLLSLRCSLLTTFSLLLIKLSMKLLSSATDQETNSTAASLPLDHLAVLSVTVLATTRNLPKDTLLILLVLSLSSPEVLFKPRVSFSHAFAAMILLSSSSPRFSIELLRRMYLRKTMRFLWAKLKFFKRVKILLLLVMVHSSDMSEWQLHLPRKKVSLVRSSTSEQSCHGIRRLWSTPSRRLADASSPTKLLSLADSVLSSLPRCRRRHSTTSRHPLRESQDTTHHSHSYTSPFTCPIDSRCLKELKRQYATESVEKKREEKFKQEHISQI